MLLTRKLKEKLNKKLWKLLFSKYDKYMLEMLIEEGASCDEDTLNLAIKYGIKDIRQMFENDIRFLEQF